MSKFSLLLLSVFVFLIAYTLYLLRSQKLSPHLAVRWVLAELAALFVVGFWGWLPFIKFTSKMDDRQLLLLVIAFLFVFLVFLLLYAFVYISANTRNIKLLTQEIALLRQKINEAGIDDNSSIAFSEPLPKEESAKRGKRGGLKMLCSLLACAWAIIVPLLFFFILTNEIPKGVIAFLSANYLE